jgi:pimeloyl-ACP methyl ester carboxylesterase
MTSGLWPWGEVSQLTLATGDDVHAFVRLAGRSAKCLLLHGNPGSMRDFEPILPPLAEVADLAIVDLPGFGASPRMSEQDEAFSLTRLSNVSVAVADSLGWRDPFFVVGHSHGGGVAQTLAALYPERVAGLGLLATLGYPAHVSYRLLALPGALATVKLTAKLLRDPVPRSVQASLLRAMMRDMFWPEAVPALRVERELARLAARPEILASMVQVALGNPCQQLLASAPTIRCPASFVHGQQDRLVPSACARNIHRAIESAGGTSRLCELPGAGHMLIEFQATRVAEQLRPLLTETRRV